MKPVIGKNMRSDFGNGLSVHIKLNVSGKELNSQLNGKCDHTHFIWNEIGVFVN